MDVFVGAGSEVVNSMTVMDVFLLTNNLQLPKHSLEDDLVYFFGIKIKNSVVGNLISSSIK